MIISIIVAMDEKGLIGVNNDLPWKISADLQYFRRITMGKPLIMGRNTHESIGRPLPGRKNIILTANKNYYADGCVVVSSLDDAIDQAAQADEFVVMGGASLYRQFLPRADRLYITRIHTVLEGDTWFPDWERELWEEISREDHAADEKNEFAYSFIVLEKIKSAV